MGRWAKTPPPAGGRAVNLLAAALLLGCLLGSVAADFVTQVRRPAWVGARGGSGGGRAPLPHAPPIASCPAQWSLVLPWTDPPSDQRTPTAVFDDRVIAFAGLTPDAWVLVATGAAGASAGQLLWTTEFPLGSSIPSTVAVAGELAVLELDGRVFAVHPGNGSVAWNATSPCSLGDPRMVNTRWV